MKHNIKNSRDILKCWHKIEYFQPYNLKEYDKEKEIRFKLNDISNKKLPWFSEAIQQKYKKDERYKLTYTIYFIIFEKNILTKYAETNIINELDELKNVAYEERLQDEGKTCFATLKVDENGSPLLDEFSVSSMPWALGKLINKNIDSVNSDVFNKDCLTLKDDILDIEYIKHPEIPDLIILDDAAIIKFIDALYRWADFKPDYNDNNFIIKIRIKNDEKKE